MRPAVIWGAILGGAVAYDVHCERRGDDSTLSCVTRSAVAATPAGPAVFTAGLIGLGVWFHRHILRPLRAAIS